MSEPEATTGPTPTAASGGGPEPREGRGRRRFDPGSVVTGLFFLGVAAVFVVAGLGGTPVAQTRVLAPALLAGLGVVGIVRVLTRSRRH